MLSNENQLIGMIWEGKSAAEKLDNFPSCKKSEHEDSLESTFIPRFDNTGSVTQLSAQWPESFHNKLCESRQWSYPSGRVIPH